MRYACSMLNVVLNKDSILLADTVPQACISKISCMPNPEL